MKDYLIGDTVKMTWINSGVTPDSLIYSMFNGDETLVASGTMTSSGAGHYFAYVTLPDTPGLYVGQTLATISTLPFKRRKTLRAVLQEVD